MAGEVVRRAVLVGINQYPDPKNNLQGCVNDALMMGKLLTENFGFRADDIRLLVDERATTANIRERLQWLVQGAAPGSVLVFHYSGHGSQVRDRNGDELEDQLDEIICPYDLNWDEPFTDDDFAQAIESVQEGVNFTLILDCCHSGTGTRVFFKEPGARGRDRSRYLAPPPDVSFRMAAGVELDPGRPERTVNMVGVRDLPTRQFGSALIEQNAIVITGCRADQTSADAWIEGDYHGALTYSLVQAITTQNYALSYSHLIETAGNWLEVNSYEQVPQLETTEAMRGWGFLNTQVHSGAGIPVSMRPASERLVPPADARVVFVHGIENAIAGHRWRAAFNRHLSLPLESFVEVVWDDAFSRNPTVELPELSPEERQRADELTEELRALVESRHELVMDLTDGGRDESKLGPGASDRASERRLQEWLLNFDDYISDFVRYLASGRIRELVDQRLTEKLTPLLRAGVPTVLISHSWGSVVAHHTLRSIGGPPLPSLHCTLGSPLWMLPIRRALDLDSRARGCDYWINVDARADLLGGSLVGKFAVNEDHTVPAIGSDDPRGSYFHPDNIAVQRDIVATAVSRIASALP